MKKFLLLFSFSLFQNSYAIELNKEMKNICLKGENGGTIEETNWNSSCLKEVKKKKVLFYIDPDEKDKNEYFSELLKYKKTLQTDDILTFAIVNTKATWKPTMIIKEVLKNKQKKYPHTTYILDNNKLLVEEWNLPDDEVACLIIDEVGKVIFYKTGIMQEQDIKTFFDILKK